MEKYILLFSIKGDEYIIVQEEGEEKVSQYFHTSKKFNRKSM